MSAELLREAAILMRERAEAAKAGPWIAFEGDSGNWWIESAVIPGDDVVADLHGENARHIASWHPAVALAVADWLDAEAAKQTPTTHLAVTFDGAPMFPVDPHALATARAYLGETS